MTGQHRAVTVPVFFYVAVTLGVPVVAAAAFHRVFWRTPRQRALFVAIVSAAWAATRPARP